MFSDKFYNRLKKVENFSLKGVDEHFTISSKKSPESYLEMFLLQPGIVLGFNHIRNKNFKALSLITETPPSNMIMVNICIKGRCELFLPEKTFVPISNNRLVFSSKFPIKDLVFPNAYYDGITFYINTNILNTESNSFLSMAEIDFNKFSKKYNFSKVPYHQFTTNLIDYFVNYLWINRNFNDIGKIRLISAMLIHEFMELPVEPSPIILLNKSQMRSIEFCKKLLCRDLSRRYTLKELSEYSNMSESNLKVKFKLAYGMTITDYMINKRMEYAKELLSNTNMSIRDIAHKCGYENHSKFSSTFRKKYEYLPLEFRHLQHKKDVK